MTWPVSSSSVTLMPRRHEVLGHFQADVAAAHHDRPGHAAMGDPGVDLVHVVEVAER